jgi:hypothetical protein
LIASLIPVVHEFVSLNLFFTAKQTVSFVLLGPNAVSISGMIERAVAQEEDEVAQLSNDFISSRLGFGSELSPEQEALAMELFGGGGPGNEQVEAEEELLEEALVFDGEGLEEQQIAEEKTKKKKKNKKKKNKAEKTDENGEALEPERKSRKIDRDTAMCVSESARRKYEICFLFFSKLNPKSKGCCESDERVGAACGGGLVGAHGLLDEWSERRRGGGAGIGAASAFGARAGEQSRAARRRAAGDRRTRRGAARRTGTAAERAGRGPRRSDARSKAHCLARSLAAGWRRRAAFARRAGAGKGSDLASARRRHLH